MPANVIFKVNVEDCVFQTFCTNISRLHVFDNMILTSFHQEVVSVYILP